MVRRSQQGRRAQAAAEKAAREELERRNERGEYIPVDRSLCRHKQWHVSVDELDTVRVETHVWHLNGRLTEFVISLRLRTLGEWNEAAYIDCKHGHIHLHPPGGADTVSLNRLDTMEDVNAGYPEASVRMDGLAVIVRDQRKDDDD